VESKAIDQFRAGLREIERTVWLQSRSDALCCGVTPAQCHALMEIGAAGELSLKELSERLGLDNSTLSRTVESLVQDGLADRSPDTRDRRATIIRLNAKGLEARDRINTTWNKLCRDVFRELPRRKQDQLIESVAVLAELLKRCCYNQCAPDSATVQGRARKAPSLPGKRKG
jgi:DNA-binding MarR family transcriptional regulator